MKKRFIAAAVPVLVAGSLAAAAPSMSQAAEKDRIRQAPPKLSAAAQAQAEVAPCTGGTQKKAITGGHADWTWTDSSITVPGGLIEFRGPASGKDTVFVTLTAPNTYVSDTNDVGRVRVLLDGVDMKPATGAAEYFYSTNNYGSFAGQYCGKVQGNGFHRVRVILESQDWDGDAFDTAYLYNPMVHVEVAD